MKRKTYSWLCLTLGLILLVIGLLLPIVELQSRQNAIIGGMDWPTYMLYFLDMGGFPHLLAVIGITLVITAVFCLAFSKTVKAHCTPATTGCALGLSAVGAMGITCFIIWTVIAAFKEMSKHPIEYPLSIALGLCSLAAFVTLTAVYLKFRKRQWSGKGLLIDIFTSVLYLPAFLWVFSYIYKII